MYFTGFSAFASTAGIHLASHAVILRGLVLPGGGNTSPLKTTAWEARIHLISFFTQFFTIKKSVSHTYWQHANFQ